MGTLSIIEKGIFLKLFSRGGYVLDFTTADFDAFTMDSIGISLCAKYNLSKGKSMALFVNEHTDEEVVKLFSDLLLYYEYNFGNEIESNEQYSTLYYRCKKIISRILDNKILLNPFAKELIEKFSSDYLTKQIDFMIKMQSENPTEAIGKAKELIESCCKTILEENNLTWDKNWNIGQLTNETIKHLKLMPRDIPESAIASTEMKAILGNLKTIALNLAALRNPYGSGHGKSASYTGLEERHAKLAVGSSITLVSFLWDTHESRSIKVRNG